MRYLLGFVLLSSCAAFRPEPLAKPEDRSDSPAIHWDTIKEAVDYCRTNGKVKKIYVSGKVICGNGGRFSISIKKEKR